MAAKAGLHRDDRRSLGGHAPPNDRSVDVYSRDSLAAPLLELAKLLAEIRSGEFDPDSSRSGRWTVFPDVLTELRCGACPKSLAGARVFLCDCGNWSHCDTLCSIIRSRCSADFCTVCESLKTHKCTKETVVAQALLADDDQSEDDSDLENDS